MSSVSCKSHSNGMVTFTNAHPIICIPLKCTPCLTNFTHVFFKVGLSSFPMWLNHKLKKYQLSDSEIGPSCSTLWTGQQGIWRADVIAWGKWWRPLAMVQYRNKVPHAVKEPHHRAYRLHWNAAWVSAINNSRYPIHFFSYRYFHIDIACKAIHISHYHYITDTASVSYLEFRNKI